MKVARISALMLLVLVAAAPTEQPADAGAPEQMAIDEFGRPLTPMSYAGVARRTTRRAVAVGAAAYGAAVVATPRAGCVQVVNAYGQLYWRCP